MDCKALKSDIAHLRSHYGSLVDGTSRAITSGHGKAEVLALQTDFGAASDSILEKYLQDFVEHGLLSTQLEVINTIEGFEDLDGVPSDLESMAVLPDGVMLAGGREALFEVNKNESGIYQLGRRIDGFLDLDFDAGSVTAISPLSDGTVLIGGAYGTLYECEKDDQGHYCLTHQIGFLDDHERSVSVGCIQPLPDGNVLVGGDHGELCVYSKGSFGHYEMEYRINGFEGGHNQTFLAMHLLSDGNVLIGGDGGALYTCKKASSGRYMIDSYIDGFEDVDGVPSTVCAIAELPDGNTLIGGVCGALYECKKNPAGNYELGSLIDKLSDSDRSILGICSFRSLVKFKDNSILAGADRGYPIMFEETSDGWRLFLGPSMGPSDMINCMVPLSGDKCMIGGDFGSLYEISTMSPTLGSLKDNLDDIIAKGGSK